VTRLGDELENLGARLPDQLSDGSLRRTEYDLELAFARYRATGDPLAEAMVATLLEPPARPEVIAHAEALEFSG